MEEIMPKEPVQYSEALQKRIDTADLPEVLQPLVAALIQRGLSLVQALRRAQNGQPHAWNPHVGRSTERLEGQMDELVRVLAYIAVIPEVASDLAPTVWRNQLESEAAASSARPH